MTISLDHEVRLCILAAQGHFGSIAERTSEQIRMDTINYFDVFSSGHNDDINSITILLRPDGITKIKLNIIIPHNVSAYNMLNLQIQTENLQSMPNFVENIRYGFFNIIDKNVEYKYFTENYGIKNTFTEVLGAIFRIPQHI